MTNMDLGRLREMAILEGPRADFVQACKDWIEVGGSLVSINEAIKGTRWRYVLTNSGTSIEVEHKDDLYEAYWKAVTEMKAWRSQIHKEKYEYEILEEIRACEAAHEKAMAFLIPGDNLSPLQRAIDEMFEHTEYRYTGRAIVWDGDG